MCSDQVLPASVPPEDVTPRGLRDEYARRVAEAYTGRLKHLVRTVLSQRIRRKEGTTAVVQDALLSFFAREPSVDDEDIWPLLASIARHKALHCARRHSAKMRAAVREIPLSDLTDTEALAAFRVGGWTRRKPSQLDALILIEFVERLPEDQRQLLEHLLQGTDKSEMASAFGCSRRTIERRIASLRESLVEQLQ
jgi:RNA polymerase sigma factor (sigma-70 family)